VAAAVIAPKSRKKKRRLKNPSRTGPRGQEKGKKGFCPFA